MPTNIKFMDGRQRFKERRGYRNVKIGLLIVLFSYTIGLLFAPFAFSYLLDQTTSTDNQIPPLILVAAAAYGGSYLLGLIYLVYTAPKRNEKIKAIFSILAFLLSILFGAGARRYGPIAAFLGSISAYTSVIYLLAFCSRVGENVDCIELENQAVTARVWFIAYAVAAIIFGWCMFNYAGNPPGKHAIKPLFTGAIVIESAAGTGAGVATVY